MTVDATWLEELVRDVPDFPKPGVVFKDITPLLADATRSGSSIDAIADHFAGVEVDRVRRHRGAGLHPRGAGRLPVRRRLRARPQGRQAALARSSSEEYELEYGTDLLEIHRDGVHRRASGC